MRTVGSGKLPARAFHNSEGRLRPAQLLLTDTAYSRVEIALTMQAHNIRRLCGLGRGKGDRRTVCSTDADWSCPSSLIISMRRDQFVDSGCTMRAGSRRRFHSGHPVMIRTIWFGLSREMTFSCRIFGADCRLPVPIEQEAIRWVFCYSAGKSSERGYGRNGWLDEERSSSAGV